MSINIKNIMLFGIVLFCFDSLFKLEISGFQLQAGVFFLFLFSVIYFVFNARKFINVLMKDKSGMLIILCLFSYSFFAVDIGVYFRLVVCFVLSYLFFVLFCCLKNEIDLYKISKYCLLLLIFTGFFQYALTHLLGVQFTFAGVASDYYSRLFGLRMRGFFLEPNWYGLVLAQWFGLFLYLSQIKKNSVPWVITITTFTCLVLCDSRLAVFLSFVYFGYYIFLNKMSNLFKILPSPKLILLFFIITFMVLSSSTFRDVVTKDRTAIARTIPLERTVSYMVDNFTLLDWTLGKGFSNWAEYSGKYNITPSHSFIERPPTARDNSELYVYFFELGLVGIILVIYELTRLRPRKREDQLIYILFISTFVFALFYPLYTFVFYILPFSIARSILINNGNENV